MYLVNMSLSYHFKSISIFFTPFNLSIADLLVDKRQLIGYKVTVAKSP